MQVYNCLQGSHEWFAARCGIITASSMSDVLAKGQGKTRATYMHKLVGEVMTGDAASNYVNEHMERGHELEGFAREIYQEGQTLAVSEVGFIRNHDDIGGVGYSPDGLVGDEGLLEIKTRLPHLQVELLLSGSIPSQHVAQIQAGLWVTGRKWLDFVSFCPGMPFFQKRIFPDGGYIEAMREEVIKFYAEMREKITKIEALNGTIPQPKIGVQVPLPNEGVIYGDR